MGERIKAGFAVVRAEAAVPDAAKGEVGTGDVGNGVVEADAAGGGGV